MAPWSIEYRVLEIYDRFLVAQVIGKSEVFFDKKGKLQEARLKGAMINPLPFWCLSKP